MAVELSVAIIFKNEIRCLERCLRSLRPLRERLSCEIVMADTGSTDASREIARKYADVVFDFPWIDDFAAARNAVLERSTGSWVLSLDADEWLDEGTPDVLAEFLKSGAAGKALCAQLRIRNYSTRAFDTYMEFYALRLLRRTAGLAFHGAIHETPRWKGVPEPEAVFLKGALLHHDGYVILNDGSEAGRAKLARNRRLMQKNVEEHPDDLLALFQLAESAERGPEQTELLRRAVHLVERKAPGWDSLGPTVLACAIEAARAEELTEFEQWTQEAKRLFPRAYATRIDVNYAMALSALKKQDYEAVILCGEAYLKGCADSRTDPGYDLETTCASIKRNSPNQEQIVRLALAEAYYKRGADEKVLPDLEKLEWGILEPDWIPAVLRPLLKIWPTHERGVLKLMPDVWSGICGEGQGRENAQLRKRAFIECGADIFSRVDNAWEMFLPLAGKCVLGDAAMLMRCDTAEAADALLEKVEDLSQLPAPAFARALNAGAMFPLPTRRITVEEMDVLADKLHADERLLQEALSVAAAAAEDAQDLFWANALALAAIQSGADWRAEENPLAPLCAFARAESRFLPFCYKRAALETPGILPPMHRFALHITNALAVIIPAAVDSRFTPTIPADIRSALGELRLAAEASPQHRAIVDLILDQIMNMAGAQGGTDVVD